MPTHIWNDFSNVINHFMIRKWFHEIQTFRIHVRWTAKTPEMFIKYAIKANKNNDRAWPFRWWDLWHSKSRQVPCASEIKWKWTRNRRWSQNNVVPIYLLVVLAALKSSLYLLFARRQSVGSAQIAQHENVLLLLAFVGGALVGGGMSACCMRADEMYDKRNPRTLNRKTHIQNNEIVWDAANT